MTWPHWKDSSMQTEEPWEGELDIDEGEDEDVFREVTLAKNFSLRKLSDLFYDIESTKNKMLAADEYLERSMPICQGIEKMLAPCSKLYRSQAQLKLLWICFLQRNKTL